MEDSHQAAAVTSGSDEKICPRCAETVKAAALVCKHCNYEFGSPILGTNSPQPVIATAPKKKHPVLIGCAGLVGLFLLLGLIGSINSPSNTSGSTSGGQEVSQQSVVDIQVTSVELAQAYEANEVAAQNTYGDKTLEVTGVVKGITLDFANDPVLQMQGVNEFLSVQASFDDTYKDRLSQISKGETVVIRCTRITEVISAPMLSDCTLP